MSYLEAHAPERLSRITRRRGGRAERLFRHSGGGYDRNIDEPETLMPMLDDVHLNPVRRGLVEQAADWRWSRTDWHAGAPGGPDPGPDPGGVGASELTDRRG